MLTDGEKLFNEGLICLDREKLRNRISSLCTHILFEYEGRNCGIDPISKKEIDVWFGDDFMTCRSVDEVMSAPVFGGKSLGEISEEVTEE